MSSRPEGDGVYLESHWGVLGFDGEGALEDWASQIQSQCAFFQPENHTSLTDYNPPNNGGCRADDCEVGFRSGFDDGYVECDASRPCVVALCDETTHESTVPGCVQGNYYDGTIEQGCAISSFGLNNLFSQESSSLLPPLLTMTPNIFTDQSKMVDHTLPCVIDSCYLHDSILTYHTPISPYRQSVLGHFECSDLPTDSQTTLTNQSFHEQTKTNPQDVFQVRGMRSDRTTCYENVKNTQPSANGLEQSKKTKVPTASECFHSEQLNVHGPFKSTNDLGLHVRGGLHRHNNIVHHHHPHSYSPNSRCPQSRSIPHFDSSLRETPPTLYGRMLSPFLSPSGYAEDSYTHICKWAVNMRGIKVPCRAAFWDSGSLQNHLVTIHTDVVDGARGNGFYCYWEGCHRADQPFSQKSKIHGHFLTHSSYKNLMCCFCGKVFARHATLDRHERSHRGDKPYKCKECGKAFTDSSQLKTHSRIHSGDKPFKCNSPGCSFTTGDSSNMSTHRLTHGERKYNCRYPGCIKSFIRPDHLKRHQRMSHNIEACLLT